MQNTIPFITGKFGEYYIWRMSHLNRFENEMTLRPPENFNLVVSRALLTLTPNKVRVVIVNNILF